MADPQAAAGGAAGPDDSASPAPRYLAGRYRLDRTLGRGAMGRVWAAHDEALNRWVAIKEVDFPRGLPPSERQQVAERAMREARAIASVADPHVVTIFDLIANATAPAIVMELLDARSLAQILVEDGPLDDRQAAIVGHGVAAGLLAAHAAGVTHRDVKPGNVLVCRDGRIKLTDFGIARSVGENSLTATGLLLGSPAYISPEVAGGESANAGSDAWGLGALLFACVEGKPPFDRGNPLRTLASVVNDPVPPHPHAGRLGVLIDGLLVKDPRRRTTVVAAHDQLRLLAGAAPTGLLPAPPSRPVSTPVQPIPFSPVAPDRPATGAAAGPGSAAASARPATASPGGRDPGSARPGPGAAAASRPATTAGRPAPTGAALPPPPWAGLSSAPLPPLPVRVRRRRPLGHWVLAVLLALAAAAAGFFGVRAVAALTSHRSAGSSAAPVSMITSDTPVDVGPTPARVLIVR